MKITRINKIKGHRVFTNFAWPNDLHDFGRFNLIYGWNGSGKTTLSNLFRHIERKEAINEGDVDFHINGNPHNGNTLAAAEGLPRIRVFNRDYVTTTVFTSQTSLSPILFIGEGSVEKQKQIEALKTERDEENQKMNGQRDAKDRARDALDSFCIQQGKTIKELLSSSGSNPYNNYNKSDFKQACEKQVKPGSPSKLLSEGIKTELKQKKDEKPKDRISRVTVSLPDLEQITRTSKDFLQRTVVSQVLNELVSNSALAQWVQDGLAHHTGDTHETCRFCGRPMPEDRIARLEAHFNDEYNRFLNEIDASIEDIAGKQKELEELQLPDKAKFYDHLSDSFVQSAATFRGFIKQVVAYLGGVHKALSQKRAKPFETMLLESLLIGIPLPDAKGASAHCEINELIAQHNTETADFQKVVTEARNQLEQCLVAEALEEFKIKGARIQEAESNFQDLQSKVKKLEEQITVLEKQIVEHRRPAEELNAEVRSYLGCDDLKFEVKDTGYQITRNGSPASNFSEGERTAIAFLYFLKSLQDKGFNLTQDIVMIDDPVSSLDANALFCAFGYMKERTKEAAQLFILTHNFGFFRQVKNWFNHLPHQNKKEVEKRPARFFMVEAGVLLGQRCSSLKKLDPLLHQFESEYHYLFKKVYDEANGGGKQGGLEQYYSMPNIARRMLDAFLAFRFPAQSGELKQQLEQVAFDPAKKSRILRFLHTYSHDGKIGEPEHDLSILAETPQILKDLLDLLNTEDSRHFGEMVKLISPPNPLDEML